MADRHVTGPIVLGTLIVILAGVGSYAGLAVAGPGPAPTRASALVSPVPATPTAVASPAPSVATAAPAATATPAPTAAGWTASDLQDLRNLVPGVLSTTCVDLQPAVGDPTRASDANAAIRCSGQWTDDINRVAHAYDVVYEMLPDAASTQTAYAARLAGAGLQPGAGGCWAGTVGEVEYSDGRVGCWNDTATGAPAVTWTYQPANVIASASLRSGTLRDLVQAWWYAARLKPLPTSAGLTADQQYVLALLPAQLATTCQPYDPTGDPTGYDPIGSLGAIDCYPTGVNVADVGWFRFTTQAALQAWYQWRLQAVAIQSDSGGCSGGTPGESTWTSGRIFCYQAGASKLARIRWTNSGAVTYGALNATGSDLLGLLNWWQTNNLP